MPNRCAIAVKRSSIEFVGAVKVEGSGRWGYGGEDDEVVEVDEEDAGVDEIE